MASSPDQEKNVTMRGLTPAVLRTRRYFGRTVFRLQLQHHDFILGITLHPAARQEDGLRWPGFPIATEVTTVDLRLKVSVLPLRLLRQDFALGQRCLATLNHSIIHRFKPRGAHLGNAVIG